MAKFEKCPEKRCIHYRIHSDRTDRFPEGIMVHFASKRGGYHLLEQAQRTNMINAVDARQIAHQIETDLGLPYSHPADLRHGGVICSQCQARSCFIISPLMAIEYMEPTSNEPVN